jgi:hypothetical protein
MSRLKVAPTIDRALVGHLDDPRARRTFGGIEYLTPAVNEQEDLLKQVVGFGTVTKYAQSDRADQTGITLKQVTQRLHITIADAGHQALI